MEQSGGTEALWMTHHVLIFEAHEVFSVVSDSLVKGIRFRRTRSVFNSSSPFVSGIAS
jgi:hypothetical protein